MASEDENEDNTCCIKFAKDVIHWKNIIKFMSEYDRFDEVIYQNYIRSVEQFLYEFESWKKIDLEKMIGALCMSYYEILNMKNQVMNSDLKNPGNTDDEDDVNDSEDYSGDNEDSGEGSSSPEQSRTAMEKQENEMYKKIMMEQFDKQLQDIENGLKKLTPDAQKHLKDFGKNIQPVAVSNEIAEVMERAYWDKFKEELKTTPPKFDTVLALFDEIGDMLKELTPNREETKQEIARVLDKDYIEYMVDQNTFNIEEIERIFSFILNKIQSYESPVRNVETRFIIKDFKEKINDDSIPFENTIAETFKISYDKINKIYQDMINATDILNHS